MKPAPSIEGAEAAVTAFEQGLLGQKLPTAATSGLGAWVHIIPFFGFPPQIAVSLHY
jgi:transposase-like protein